MPLQTNNIYEFDGFRLDFSEKTLRNASGVVPIAPKVFDTLCLLVENAGHLIEKDELMQKLWQDRFVEESNLTFNIKMLRRALGDDAQKPRFLETVPKRGYRFIAEVRRLDLGEKNERKEDHINGFSPASLFPLSTSPAPSHSPSHTGAVVALADWRHQADTAKRREPHVTSVRPELASTRPVISVKPGYLTLVAVGVIAAAIGLGYYFWKGAGDSAAIDSVAVLPFVNSTGDPNTEYLSEGISDGIINSLARLPHLRVNSLNSVMRYKGKEADPQSVGRELNVRAVLIGTLTRQGDD